MKKERKESNIHESGIHNHLCNYVRHYWPHVEFITDLSGLKLPPGQALKILNLRSRRLGVSDFLMFEPRGGYKGFFLELKRDLSSFKNKDGSFKSEERFWQQDAFLQLMRARGYYADFGVTWDSKPSSKQNWKSIKDHLDSYMRLPPDYNESYLLELRLKLSLEFDKRSNKKSSSAFDRLYRESLDNST